jgi:hypothetical protein
MTTENQALEGAPALPPLPDTTYSLYYQWSDDEDHFGGSEVIDANGYTADQMRDYARAALAAQPQAALDYQQANPLGGPAKVFRAMADAIEAGDSYEDTLRRYRFAEAKPAPAEGDAQPVAWISPEYFTAFSRQGFQVSTHKVAPGLVPLYAAQPKPATVERERDPNSIFQTDGLPERNPSKPAEQQGLFRKFVVTRTDGSDKPGGKHENCEYFVLDVGHDKHAPAALWAYAQACKDTHPDLAADLIERYELAASKVQPKGMPAGSHLSWGGFNVHGDPDSINAVKLAIHDASTVPQWKARVRDNDRMLSQTIDEREERQQFIDGLLDALHGPDRHEWTSAYHFPDAMEDALERIAALEAAVPCAAPAPTVDLIELAAKAVFQKLSGWCGQRWDEGGNSLKQDEARRYARAALEAVPSPAVKAEPTLWRYRRWTPDIDGEGYLLSPWYETRTDPRVTLANQNTAPLAEVVQLYAGEPVLKADAPDSAKGEAQPPVQPQGGA